MHSQKVATLELHIKCSNITFSFTCMIGTLNVSYEIYCNHILTLQPRQVNKQNSFLNTVRKLQDHHMAITWPSHDHHMTITRQSLTVIQLSHFSWLAGSGRQSACYTTGHTLQHTPQHFNVNANANVCLERTNLLSQMRPLKLWKVLDVPQVVVVIAAFLATYSCRTGDSL